MSDAQFQQIAKTVADPSRLAALQLIAKRGEVSCTGVCEHLGLTPATVSHHAKELVESGLVEQRREAKYMLLSLNRGVWDSYLRELRRRIPSL